MKRSWAIIAASLVCGTAQLLAPSPGVAAQPLTITGPAVATYARPAIVTGTTPLPDQQVAIGVSQYASMARENTARTVYSDATGRFTASIVPSSPTTYYEALVGSAHSAVKVMTLAKASCSFSGPAFTKLPGTGFDYGFGIAFATFTTASNGLWAGVEYDGLANISVIDWRSGQGNPTVLDTFNYATGVGFSPAAFTASVEAIGITTVGGVVVRAQVTTSQTYETRGYVYLNGRRTMLAMRPGWTSAAPTGVTSDGHIIGEVSTGTSPNETSTVVEWNGAGTTVQPLVPNAQLSSVDGNGDISFYMSPPSGPYGFYIRMHSTGRIVPFEETPINPPVGGVTDAFYGRIGGDKDVEWVLSPTTSLLQPISLFGLGGTPLSVSANSDVVMINVNTNGAVLVTHTGKLVEIPNQTGNGFNPLIGTVTVAPGGIVAYTSWVDGLIRFLSCS